MFDELSALLALIGTKDLGSLRPGQLAALLAQGAKLLPGDSELEGALVKVAEAFAANVGSLDLNALSNGEVYLAATGERREKLQADIDALAEKG